MKWQNMSEKLDYYKAPEISNSKLSLFSYDPWLYYKTYVTQEIVEKKESESMLLGSLIHCILLEPHVFHDKYEVSTLKNEEIPTAMMLEFVKTLAKYPEEDDLSYEAAYLKSGYKITKDKVVDNYKKVPSYQKYKAELQSPKTIISQATFDQATRLAAIASTNPQWSALVKESWHEECEKEIFFASKAYTKNAIYVFELKSKLDRLVYHEDSDEKILYIRYFDYKTDSQRPIYKYEESFNYWKTYRQLAFYRRAIESWVQDTFSGDYKVFLEMYIVPIDVVREKSTIYKIDESYLDKGDEEIQQDLDNLAWHIESDQWEFPKSFYDQQPMPVLKYTPEDKVLQLIE
jgi:hypothetical protein